MYNKSIIEEKSKRFAIRIIKATPYKAINKITQVKLNV